MSQLANQWIDLFRAGDHGEKGQFTEQDVQQIVDNYRPEFHEAPAVIGHPESNAPAYGWWGKVRRVGDLLQGMLKPDVDPVFEEMVKSGRFKKRSVALYKGENGYSLRHVGFLGAQPPEIKGLADIKFNEQDRKAIAIEFAEEKENSMPDEHKNFMDSLKEFFDKRFPAATAPAAPATFSEADVKRISAEAAAAAVAPLQAQLDQQKVTFSETQTSQQKAEAANRASSAILRVKTAGAWVPAFDRMGLPLVFSELAAKTDVVTFGEGDLKTTKTPLEVLTTFMENLKQIVPASAVYTGQSASAPGISRGVNAGPKGVDPSSVVLDSAIRKFAEDNKVSYSEATFKVLQEHPELQTAGGASAGSV